MMAQLKTRFEESDETGSYYWFAQVLPEEGGNGRSEYLAIYCGGGELKLVRKFAQDSHKDGSTTDLSACNCRAVQFFALLFLSHRLVFNFIDLCQGN
jgi:hypothetical protein